MVDIQDFFAMQYVSSGPPISGNSGFDLLKLLGNHNQSL